MGAHYIMKKPKSIITAPEKEDVVIPAMNEEDNKHVTISFENGSAPTVLTQEQASPLLTVVFETGETGIFTPKQAVIMKDGKFDQYELLGWQERQEGKTCLFFLGDKGNYRHVKMLFWFNLVDNVAVIEEAPTISSNYLIANGILYRGCGVNIHSWLVDEGPLNVGKLPFEFIEHTRKWWFRWSRREEREYRKYSFD